MTPEIMKAAAVMAAMLFVVSYLADLTLMRLDVSPSSTILNDIAIAMIATGVMLFYLFVTHTQNIFLRAKERMNLTAELNFHLSRALLEFRSTAEVEDRDERLSGFRLKTGRARRVSKIGRWSRAARLRVLRLHGHALRATFPPVRL